MKCAIDLYIENCKCSDGWISDTFQRRGIKRVNIHGNKNDMTEEEYEKVIIPWIKELQKIHEEKGVTPSALYNADQNSLFYQKLPNSLNI